MRKEKIHKMKLAAKKVIILVSLLLSIFSSRSLAHINENGKPPKWFIALPLRFTHLQNNTTMLSGIKLGKSICPKINASFSVYHSFYLNSFKAEANLFGYTNQPRLFINSMGVELEYVFFNKNKWSSSIQMLMAWGFMKYDLKEYDFESIQVNYLNIEPTINTEYKIGSSTILGLGIGYRPLLSDRKIKYTSTVSSGIIPLEKNIPNGVNVILIFKGFL